MKVLGGDCFCGWPTSLHLSTAGHDVTIVDNLSGKRIDGELDIQSLKPFYGKRVARWPR